VAGQDNLGLEFGYTGQGGVEVVDLKPEEHAISMREAGVADRTVMMLHLPAVQSHDQLAARNKLFILRTAMTALATQEPLIPATARFNITNTNEGLGTHTKFVS